MIKGVIFDVGGVLAHDVWEPMLSDIARTNHLPAASVRRVGERLWSEYDRRKATRPGDLERFEREYWRKFRQRVRGLPASLSVERLMEISDRYIRAVDAKAMAPVLARLKRKGLQLAICSNNNEFWFPRQFYWLGLDRFFDREKVVLSCHEGAVKAPRDFRMFLAAARRLGLPPRQCLLIDDRAPYLERAAQYGMQAIRFSGYPDLDRQLRAMRL